MLSYSFERRGFGPRVRGASCPKSWRLFGHDHATSLCRGSRLSPFPLLNWQACSATGDRTRHRGSRRTYVEDEPVNQALPGKLARACAPSAASCGYRARISPRRPTIRASPLRVRRDVARAAAPEKSPAHDPRSAPDDAVLEDEGAVRPLWRRPISRRTFATQDDGPG